MKKLFTLALALLLALTMALSAFATESPATNNGGNTDISVNGTYVASAAAITISVDIAWEAMEFTYTAGTPTWDPENHTETPTAGTWSSDGKEITVTNHSNVAINAGVSFTKVAGTNINGRFTITNRYDGVSNEMAIASAKGTEVANAPSATATFKVTYGTISENGTLGTITVQISQLALSAENIDSFSQRVGDCMYNLETYLANEQVHDSIETVESGVEYMLREDYNRCHAALQAFNTAYLEWGRERLVPIDAAMEAAFFAAVEACDDCVLQTKP